MSSQCRQGLMIRTGQGFLGRARFGLMNECPSTHEALPDYSASHYSFATVCHCPEGLFTGTSPTVPHWIEVTVPCELDGRMYHIPPDGRKTAISVLPSPS